MFKTSPGAVSSPAAVLTPVGGAALRPSRHQLTNLAHLDFLGDRVTPPQQAGHTTYRLAQEPAVGTLWTYADRQADGSFKRVGGGTYDAAHDTYGQGAFNADDMARAAVVYLRHWKQTGARLEPARGVRDAARPDLPADHDRCPPRQRGALDAARRHPAPERRSRRAARPVRQRRVVLAGPHGLGPGGGVRRLRAHRPRLRAVPAQPARPRHRRARPAGARHLRAAT